MMPVILDTYLECVIRLLFKTATTRNSIVIVFTVLVILCLMQNSGILRSINQLVDKEAPQLSLQSQTEFQSLEALSLQSCELSEKSLRVCIDEPNLNLVLFLLFLIPLLPSTFRQLSRFFDVPILPKPRRIHPCFCRFQE